MSHGNNIGARVSPKQLPRVMTTTTTKQSYSYHPERCTGRLYSRSLVYTAISFLQTLYSCFRVFPCNINRLDPVLNVPESTTSNSANLMSGC